MEYEKNNKVRMPLEHYKEEYKKLDAHEIAARTNIPFNDEKSVFEIRIMNEAYTVGYPEYSLRDAEGNIPDDYAVQILIAHYLCSGRFAPSLGKQLTYRDVPWGDTYFGNFKGRCLARLAYAFGYKLDLFGKVMESIGAEKVSMGDAGYKFEFINGLYVYYILWAADDEFPPSSQILFEDNLPYAFTAEDLAVLGDISIGKLKAIAKAME